MTREQLKNLGIDDPSKPVTRGELVSYMASVIERERKRLAYIFADSGGMHPQDVASMINDDRDDVLSWDVD